MAALGCALGAGGEGAEGAESQIAEITEGQRRAESVTHPRCLGGSALRILRCMPDGDIGVSEHWRRK